MIRSNGKSKVALVGVFCLPTSSKFHVHEPKRSGAFKEGQVAYVLSATQSVDDGGYPPQVVLTSDDFVCHEDGNPWSLEDEVKTQHAQVRKNLPPRRVTGILYADGSSEGELPMKGLGLPHWSFIPTTSEGSASLNAINEVDELLKRNREEAKAAKEAVRAAKKGNTSAAA